MVRGKSLRYRLDEYSTQLPNGCVEWIGDKVHDGYGRIWVDKKTRRAHRAAWFDEYGEWPVGMLIHSCDNRACINVEHLSIGTAKQNIKEMCERNPVRGNYKDNHPKTKILMKDKWLIYNSKLSRAELARMYNVSWTCIDAILKKPREYFT